MNIRPRRLRQSIASRSLVQETSLTPADFVYPLFLTEGKQQKQSISALPGQYRWSLDLLPSLCEEIQSAGIQAVVLFPKIEEQLKDPTAKEALNPKGLIPRAIDTIKKSAPDLMVITDIALDPFSSMGHDGLVSTSGEILNDDSLDVLGKMTLIHAEAGADAVSPSDMMDGRVGHMRRALESQGHHNTMIISYTAKYASAFYGPFRAALDSAPKSGDKKTYQMDPANQKEALKELLLDQKEGADVVLVKPALAYLDVIQIFKQHSRVPIAAYNVSGEYSMIKAAGEKGWIDEKACRDEMLLAIKRAGADMIFSYFALEYCQDYSK